MTDSQQYIDRMRTSLPNPEYYEKLKRPDGLVTSIHRSDLDNCEVMLTVILVYMNGETLEISNRNSEEWYSLQGVPVDFMNFKYRIAR